MAIACEQADLLGGPLSIHKLSTDVCTEKQILFLIGMGKLDENEKAYDQFFESIKKATAGDE